MENEYYIVEDKCPTNIDFEKLYENLFEMEIRRDKDLFIELYKIARSKEEYEHIQLIEGFVNSAREETYSKTLKYVLNVMNKF